MFERVLAVGRPELEPSEKLEELRMKIGDADLEGRGFAVAEQLFFHLTLDFCNQLFDAAGVDPAILDEIGQSLPGDLTPHGLEARQDHGARRVIDDQVDTGGLLEGSDIATLAADDPPLHLI